MSVRGELGELRGLVIRQGAMICALVGMLVDSGALDPQSAVAIAVAGKDPMPGMSHDRLMQWLRDSLTKKIAKGDNERGAQQILDDLFGGEKA